MIHSSSYQPRIYPVDSDVGPAQIDRLQELSASSALNREKIKEIGRDGVVDYRKATPDISLTGRQLEYGTLDFWRKLANKSDAVTQINFSDFKTPRFDIAGYETDDNGTFTSTIWYPNLRTQSFSINIGDPEALIERNFTFIGEDEITLRKDNKYLIHKRYVIASTGNDQTVTVNDPAPVADPDNSGRFLHKVVKISGTTATVLTHGTQWSYDGTNTLTINGSSTAGDVILVWYSAGSYISGQNPFTDNDSDDAGIAADSSTILLLTNTTVTRLQSIALEVNMDRFDVQEIGNKEKVQFGVRDITARVTLGRILETYSIEEILRGKSGTDYGLIDVRNFSTGIALIAKVFSNNSKSTFRLGYKVTDLAPVATDKGTPTDDYIQRGATLEGEIGFITNVEAVL